MNPDAAKGPSPSPETKTPAADRPAGAAPAAGGASGGSAASPPAARARLRFYGEGLPYLPAASWPGSLIVVEGTDGAGRSTQIAHLVQWLKVQGFSVLETGWLRSKLMGQAVNDAKKGHTLTRLTYTLFYATDFADRLEHQILPALQAGSIVLADRYIFTSIARSVVRGVHPEWVRELFGFAPRPDLTFYLKLTLDDLIYRTLRCRRMNYWESGMDLNLGQDLYESFSLYQAALLREFDSLSQEYGFQTLDGAEAPAVLQRRLREHIGRYLEERYGRPVATSCGPSGDMPALPARSAVAKPAASAKPARKAAKKSDGRARRAK